MPYFLVKINNFFVLFHLKQSNIYHGSCSQVVKVFLQMEGFGFILKLGEYVVCVSKTLYLHLIQLTQLNESQHC